MANPIVRKGLIALAVMAMLTSIAVPASAGIIKERRTLPAGNLEVRNLIGEISVEGHAGREFEVEITIQGADANEGRLQIDDSGGRLTIVFPRADRFIYPRLGSGSRTKFSMSDGDDMGWLSSLFGRGRVEVRGSGRGLEVWADLAIKVPRGSDLVVRHGVGKLDAAGVDGNLEMRIRSGHAEAADINGDLNVDTGSGHVDVTRVVGNLLVDTGSGHVEASEIEGETIDVDTGSGHVSIDSVRTEKLRVDTGSGRVKAERVSTDNADIDTGSGGVTLQLDRMGPGNYRIDTGSGGIRLVLPDDAAADFRAETGSGGIDIDIDEGVKLRHMERNEAAFSIGGGGARIELDTGSGGIRISR